MSESPAERARIDALRREAPSLEDPEAARARAAIEARLFGDAGALGDQGPEDRAPTEPTLVGRYEIRARLGAGGMGVVYRAHDPQLDREVAVKLLRPDGPQGEDVSRARSRLYREARAMARLAHPNVIHVYDFGAHEGQVFVAMELVDGVNLARWLERQPRSPRDPRAILSVFLAAGEGLVAAHDAGLVHRDFKPENVLVGDDGRVRVLDFGLARAPGGEVGAGGRARSSDAPARDASPAVDDGETLASGSLTPEASLTRTGALVGTPRYMAREQILGRPADARTDQFSFCVALYEGLYGQRAFAGVSVHAYFDSVLEGRVEPPPAGAEVPALVWEAVRRGLDPDPAARHESMSALLSRLRAALEPANAPAGPLWLRTGGPLLILGAVATAALLILRPPRSEPEPAPPRPVEAPAKAVPDTGQASTTTAAAPELVAPDREAADAGLGATAPADETTTTTEATEATATPPEPRRSGWCSMHEDRYTLIHRGPRRHAHVLDRGGRCFECRVETRRDRVRRFQPADCAHYQVCRPVDREECS